MPNYTVEGEMTLKYTGETLDQFTDYLADELWANDVTNLANYTRNMAESLDAELGTGLVTVSMYINAEDAPEAMDKYKTEIEKAFTTLGEPMPIIRKYTINCLAEWK